MKSKIVTMVLLATASVTFGQSTTDTNCTVNGQMVNCKSTTTNPTPPTGGWLSGLNKTLAANREKANANHDQQAQNAQQTQLSPDAIRELFAQEKQARDAKDTVDFVYCRQNLKSDITDSDGKQKSCADVIAYTKAFCSVNPNEDRCTLARSKVEVEKAFAALAEDYNTDPRRKKKDVQEYFDSRFAKLTRWGCMSFPDMTLPQRDGTAHPCPDALEAGSQTR